ncbi:hypothetical protein [Paenibacillus sp. XY044]|uniref:hypothetical protein n=1 Tax=Paenibacillus sp. XY044 TaxID=2026089 RepID=UPI000B9932AF|nr:hypothetical protein [Paenibacillus sp. XY044]OZB92189.1 hypothetical protein CJP46_24955 [Paenibacillus sp. XY044]
MKLNIIKITAALVFAASSIVIPNVSLATSNNLTTEFTEHSTSVLQINTNKSVVEGTTMAQLLDIRQGKLSKVLSPNQKILDMHVMNNPTKVVILTAGSHKRIEKHVYNEDGDEISKSEYKITVPEQGKVEWVAPAKGVNERIMVQNGDLFTLCTSSGNPVVKYNAQLKDSTYEHVNIVDWDFSAYPYIAIKYAGQRTMAEDYFIRIVNLYSKTSIKVPGLNIDKQLRIDKQGLLNIWNSYTYEEITPANVAHPDPTQKQKFHVLYSMSTGKALTEHQLLFKQASGQEASGWNTQIVGDTVFVQDLSTGLWSLYPTGKSESIASEQTGLEENPTFVGYNPHSKAAYFLETVNSSSPPTIKKVTLK